MSPRTPVADEKTETKDSPEQLPAEPEVEEEAPVIRYFTTTIEVFCRLDDAETSDDALEAAVKEQVTLPAQFDIHGRKANVIGGKVTGSSESTDAPKPETGFGREFPEEEEDEKKS